MFTGTLGLIYVINSHEVAAEECSTPSRDEQFGAIPNCGFPTNPGNALRTQDDIWCHEVNDGKQIPLILSTW